MDGTSSYGKSKITPFLIVFIIISSASSPLFAKITGPPVKPPEQTPFPDDPPENPVSGKSGQAGQPAQATQTPTGSSASAAQGAQAAAVIPAANEEKTAAAPIQEEAIFWLIALCGLSVGAMLMGAHLIVRKDESADMPTAVES